MNPRRATLIFFLILSAWLALISATYARVTYPAGPDEYWYYNYASEIGYRGLGAISGFFRDYCADGSAWVFPNPFRVGYFMLGAFWLKLAGFKCINLAYLSLLAYLLTLAASFIFCRRYLGQKIAFVSLALLAFSPLGMSLSRRATADTLSNLFLILSLLLFFECRQKKNVAALCGLTLVYSLALLIKETAAVFIIFFLGWILYGEISAKTYFKGKFTQKTIAALIIPFVLVLTAYISFGAFDYIAPLARIIVNSPASNEYAKLYGGGPWFRYLVDFFLLSPAVFIMALFFTGIKIFVDRKPGPFIAYAFACCGFTLLIFNLFTKNVRYVFLADWFIRVFAAIMICAFASCVKNFQQRLLILLVVLFVLYDYAIFNKLFLSCGIYDPVSITLLKAWNFIP